jgi:Zn finger protein HypA/HybF involved in hydrogenase expression
MFVTRRCSKCKQELPLEAFNNYRGGKQYWCRECFRSYFRARGEVHRRQARRSNSSRRRVLRETVLAHLADHRCVDCGEGDARVLEFDHVEPRSAGYVAHLVQRGVRPEILEAEIERCEVVCANCHRRRTATRAGWRRLAFSGNERLHRKPFVDRNLRWLLKTLRDRGCIDCGTTELVLLDFDHLGAKRGNVTALARDGYSRAVLEAEVARCGVRCANCHRKRTVETQRHFRCRALTSAPPP